MRERDPCGEHGCRPGEVEGDAGDAGAGDPEGEEGEGRALGREGEKPEEDRVLCVTVQRLIEGVRSASGIQPSIKF